MSTLSQLRASRGFDAAEVAGAKIGRLARWFAREQLDAAVIGASGGVDSSLVLALACAARIKRVVALVMPIEGQGATRQAEAAARGRAAATAVGAEIWEAPLGAALAATIAELSRASGLAFDAWAEGQCLSVMCSAATCRPGTTPTSASPGPRDTISLDAMRPSAYPIAISRCYALGGYQAFGHVARPGAGPLAEQLTVIPPGDYTLFDDDSMTDGTLEAVRAMLPAHVRIGATRLAIAHDADEDVVDSRDFLLGADDAGLVVQLPRGVLGRAPYVLPYVDPAARCSIPPQHARAFSIAVWQRNERVFATTGHRVCDLPAPSRAAFAHLGTERPLAGICRWHIERLLADA